MTKIQREAWREMFFGKRFRRWAFYFLLLFLAVMTIHDAINLTSQYLENPKQADMNIVFNDSITFPAMTFCMSKEQAFSHFDIPHANDSGAESSEWKQVIKESLANMTDKDSFLKSPWDYRLVVKAYQAIATVNSLERESTPKSARRDIGAFARGQRFHKIRLLVKNWLNIIKERNVTFTEFQQKVGLETIRRSLRMFSRLSSEDDPVNAQVKVTWISLLYICFQPVVRNGTFGDINEQVKRRLLVYSSLTLLISKFCETQELDFFLNYKCLEFIQILKGEFFKMILMHNTDRLNTNETTQDRSQANTCITVDLHGRVTTLARNMEGKGRVRDGITEVCVGKMYEVRVDVRALYIMLPNEEKPTACRNYDEGDESEFDCRSRCRMEMLQEMCLCTGLTLQYIADAKDLETFPPCDYEKCGIRAHDNYTDQLCADKCLPDCKQTRYNVFVDQKGRAMRPDFTIVTMIWGSFEYLKLEQQYTWTMTTFIAALGGSIGMWLGLSALSLIQFLMFVAGLLTTKVKRKITVSQVGPSGAPSKVFAANPFSGPVATNPFDSPFSETPSGKKYQRETSLPAQA